LKRYAIENLFGIEGLNIAWYGIIIACGMVLGQAIGRWRNFVNQEAYGKQITNPSLCFFLTAFCGGAALRQPLPSAADML
jgi:prolipoprotein diacylglyceryltransferase